VLLKEVEDPTRFGVAVMRDGALVGFVEKPKEPPTRLALIGVYLFTPAVFDYVKRLKPSWRGEYEVTDALTLMLQDGRRVDYVIHGGWWLDIGKKDDVLAANALLLDQRARLSLRGVLEAARVEGRVIVEEGAVVKASTIRGPAAVCKGAVVERSFIGPYTSVGCGARVVDSYVEHSVIMDGASVEGVNRLEDSVVGRYAVVKGSPHYRGSLRLHVSDYSVVEL
jgi:glucose-1-phosphate thymidylyltransferase